MALLTKTCPPPPAPSTLQYAEVWTPRTSEYRLTWKWNFYRGCRVKTNNHVGLISSHSCPLERGHLNPKQTCPEGNGVKGHLVKVQAERGVDKPTSQGTPKMISKHQKLGRGKEGFPVGFSENTALLAPGFRSSGLPNHDTIDLCSSKPPSLSSSVSTALGK